MAAQGQKQREDRFIPRLISDPLKQPSTKIRFITCNCSLDSDITRCSSGGAVYPDGIRLIVIGDVPLTRLRLCYFLHQAPKLKYAFDVSLSSYIFCCTPEAIIFHAIKVCVNTFFIKNVDFVTDTFTQRSSPSVRTFHRKAILICTVNGFDWKLACRMCASDLKLCGRSPALPC